MHASYEVSASNGSKVIANVKVDNRQTNKQTDRQTNKQTGQKQYAPDHSIWGIKTFGKFFRSYSDLLSKFGEISFQEYVTEGVSPGILR